MKIVQINTISNGSTGNIMMSIHNQLLKDNVDSYVIWGRGRDPNNKNEIRIKKNLDRFHFVFSRITGITGFCSINRTKMLLKRIDEIKPDIIHLHNIHGYYINIELLFDYIKKNKIKTVWTLHDCWAFTGHCAYFSAKNCDKWKTQCQKCPLKHDYPKSSFDASKWSYKRKKEIFTGVDDLTIVTPSLWLANLVKQSFLKEYKIEVIYNGIDDNIFKVLNNDKIKFRKKYHLDNKHIILGVAYPWTERKGLKDFIELSKIIDDKFVIVLVGLSDNQIKDLPSNIIGLTKTNNAYELAEIYNSADVFVNPSVEETFGLTTTEAIACGTNCIVYNSTALPEIANKYGGKIVEPHDFKQLYSEILKTIEKKPINNIVDNIDDMTNNYEIIYNVKKG